MPIFERRCGTAHNVDEAEANNHAEENSDVKK
jgi:hypothetical protein